MVFVLLCSFLFLGHPEADGIPGPAIRFKLQLRQRQIRNPPCQAGRLNLHPSAPETLPILLCHGGTSLNSLVKGMKY